MKASISITTYNRKELSLFCIDSIIDNTPRDKYKLIVVDNGSTDGTVDILKDYRYNKKIDKIILNEKNKGLGHSISQAFSLKDRNIDWLITFSNDHFVMSGWFENLERVVTDINPDYVYCVLRKYLFDSKKPKYTKNGGCYLSVFKNRTIGAGLAIKNGKEKHILSDRRSPGSFSTIMRNLNKRNLVGVELGKPCALTQLCGFGDSKYEDYYKRRFSGNRRKWENFKKYEYTYKQEEYYEGTDYFDDERKKYYEEIYGA